MRLRARPSIDPELQAALDLLPSMPPITMDMLPALRAIPSRPTISELVQREIALFEYTIPAFHGDDILISILRREDHAGVHSAGAYYIHGGGMIGGDRWTGADRLVNWVAEFDAVVATIEYRLAPDFPDPVPVEDAYAGLVWSARNAQELGFDPARVLVSGAAPVVGSRPESLSSRVIGRDPALAAQFLGRAMLDDSDSTASTQQFESEGRWVRETNRFASNCLLGKRAGTDDVSIYAAPERARDLSGLPPTYLDVGSAEVFRDEVVAYALKIWEAGSDAELHVRNGDFHGFETVQTAAAIAQLSARTREA
jgi:acetyl esterase/lipase